MDNDLNIIYFNEALKDLERSLKEIIESSNIKERFQLLEENLTLTPLIEKQKPRKEKPYYRRFEKRGSKNGMS